MCGIAGIYCFKGKKPDPGILGRMSDKVSHRGPDASGTFYENAVGLAHRRLSIIDRQVSSNQPLEDVSGRFVLVFNGEIYNYKILRDQLLSKGKTFKTRSDSEVILETYKEWGSEKLHELLDGMFALAIYDRKSQELFLCRDRFGKKPLYYYSDEDHFSFASEIQALYPSTKNLTLDYHTLDYYLTELSSPQPRTIWNEIRQLPPSSSMLIGPGNKPATIRIYPWTPTVVHEKINEQEALEETERLLKEAIVRRLNADVPVGFFLSGGADSGLITALAAGISSESLQTFSAGFSFADHNELPQAAALARRYGTNHTEVVLEAKPEKDIEQILKGMGEPFGDSSCIPSWYISKEIGAKLRVAVSGDGGDELFGGYHEFLLSWQAESFFKAHPTSGSRLVARLKDRLGRSGTEGNAGNLIHYQTQSGALKLYRQMGFDPRQKKKLYAPSFREAQPYFALNHLQECWDKTPVSENEPTKKLMLASTNTRLLNDYLVKIDRTSMMHSLEIRSPFMDQALCNFGWGLPEALKFKNGQRKYLLNRLAEKYIDPGFSSRPKMGFSLPLKYWLRKELKDFARDVLFSQESQKRGIFNISYLQTLFREHQEGSRDHTDRLFLLISLELWMREFKNQ